MLALVDKIGYRDIKTLKLSLLSILLIFLVDFRTFKGKLVQTAPLRCVYRSRRALLHYVSKEV